MPGSRSEEDHTRSGSGWTTSRRVQDSLWKSQSEGQRTVINGESVDRGRLKNRTEQLRKITRHTRSQSVTCHPAAVTFRLYVSWYSINNPWKYATLSYLNGGYIPRQFSRQRRLPISEITKQCHTSESNPRPRVVSPTFHTTTPPSQGSKVHTKLFIDLS